MNVEQDDNNQFDEAIDELSELVVGLYKEEELFNEVMVLAKEYTQLADGICDDGDTAPLSESQMVMVDSLKKQIQNLADKYGKPYDDMHDEVSTLAGWNALSNILDNLA